MFKAIFISLITCLCLVGQGQVLTFNSMGTKNMLWWVNSACADSSNNIFISGDFVQIGTGNYWGIAKWDGTKWDSLGSGFHVPGQSLGGCDGPKALAFYKNHIYAGGVMNYVDGKPIKYIARWNGLIWDSLPQSPNAVVDRMTVLNGKLYVMGNFTKIGTMNYSRIAEWDGTSWSPVIMPYSIDLADVAEYNGELYFGGLGSVDLVKFDGTNWSVVGNGIVGGFSWVNSLKVYNNELYIGGYFFKGAGNAGDFLCKWDGVAFKEVVQGLDGQIWSLTEVPDGLIATGCFTQPAPFFSVLKISNAGVCGYNNVFNNCLNGAVYNNNKLYLYGAHTTINGDSLMRFVNYTNYTTQTDTCIAFVNEIEETYISTNIRIFPNPTTSIINIVDEQNELRNSTIQIKDYLGQVVFTTPFTTQINLSDLSAGLYFLTIKNDSISKTVKIIKE